jgi:hypothetical protein
VKQEILADTYTYHGNVPDELKNCKAFDRVSQEYIQNCTLSACEQNAVLLSDKRQGILEHVRATHLTSGVLSELFDGYRGVDQSTKIQELFSRKTCETIIASSDKTNGVVDSIALMTFVVGLLIVWRFMRGLVIAFR